jgi:type IV pilus assembly protein PilB
VALRIGELLIQEGKLTEHRLQEALAEQQSSGQKLGEVLVRLGFVDETTLIQVLARQLGILRVVLDLMPPVAQDLLKHIPEDVARRLKVCPLHLKHKKLLGVVMTDPSNGAQVDELKQLTGLAIEPLIATPSSIIRMIERSYEHAAPPEPTE